MVSSYSVQFRDRKEVDNSGYIHAFCPHAFTTARRLHACATDAILQTRHIYAVFHFSRSFPSSLLLRSARMAAFAMCMAKNSCSVSLSLFRVAMRETP